jgi:hypothetical protein
MQQLWKHGRIRSKNTREGASPTRPSPKDGDGFAIWLAMYRERLERICKGAELTNSADASPSDPAETSEPYVLSN